jgi:hypothetical protein
MEVSDQLHAPAALPPEKPGVFKQVTATAFYVCIHAIEYKLVLSGTDLRNLLNAYRNWLR